MDAKLNVLGPKLPETLIVFVDDSRKAGFKIADESIMDSIKTALSMDFRGKAKETQVLYPTASKLGVKRLVLVGLGAHGKISGHSLRTACSVALQACRGLAVTKNLGVLIPSVKKFKVDFVAQSLVEGEVISQLNFFEFRTDRKADEAHRFERLTPSYWVADKKDLKPATEGSTKGRIIAEGVNWGRTLIMRPGSHLHPAVLAKEAQKMATTSPSKSKIKVEIWTEKELEKNKFGGVLGVGQGSINPPRFIILEYWGAKKSDAPIVLVGKGITFDSGGLSLKPPQGQETMKYDMAGSASVLSAFKIATDLGLKVNLVCLVPSAENMPSGTAIRPGDVLHMASGKTIEVLNTDAEGRLILADALFWASTKYQPRCILDVATLTGACAMAVGEAAAGVFSNSKKLWSAIQSSSSQVQEGVWHLPDFPEVYWPMLKSDIADMKNTGGRTAGASTASLFLSAFVLNNIPWAHFDIAGAGWWEAGRDFVTARGSSGIPIRLLANFIEENSTSKFN